jgi:Domain of unknown function (DUF4173)
MFTKISPRIYILVYSIIASFLLISSNSFNYLGWAIFGVIQVVILCFSKVKISRLDWFFAGAAVLSAVNFGLFVNPLTLFFSTVTFLYASGWLITKLPQDRLLQFFHLVLPYLYSAISALGAKDNLPTLFFKKTDHSTKIAIVETKSTQIPSKPSFINNQLIGNILLTILVLAIIIPLLSFANPQFGKYIDDFFNLQWIKDFANWLIENVFSPILILRLLVIVTLYNFLPRLHCYCQSYEPASLDSKPDFAIAIPKIATVLTLFVFLAVQLQTTLNPALLTKTAGNIANETFFHLSVVCFVAFGLIYLNFKDKFSTKIWSLILLVQTLILGAIAFQSDWNYIVNWGLTHKRLYGFSILSMVAGAIAIFTFYTFCNHKKMIQTFAILFVAVSVITNLFNFDNLIYNNPPKEATGLEQNYVNQLSLDTSSLKERYTKVIDKYNTIPKEALGSLIRCEEVLWLDDYNDKITYLKSKYGYGVRTLDWNFGEYINYLQAKDISITIVQYDNSYKDPTTFKNSSQLTKQHCYTREYQPGSITHL